MNRKFKKLIALASISALFCGFFSCSDKNDEVKTVENEVIECIMTRKSVRQFLPKEVSNDTIEIILKAGMAAPTAVNKQPWKFVVLKDKDLLKILSDSMPNTRTATATMAIVVCGDMSKALEGNAREFWVQDCSAATENILLAAHSLNLGAVWTGLYPNIERANFVARLLELENKYIPLCVIPVGYPAENPNPKNKWNVENVIYK